MPPKKETLNKHSSSAIGVTSAEIVKDKVVEDKAGRQFRELKGCMNKENALILIYEVEEMVHSLLPSGQRNSGTCDISQKVEQDLNRQKIFVCTEKIGSLQKKIAEPPISAKLKLRHQVNLRLIMTDSSKCFHDPCW